MCHNGCNSNNTLRRHARSDKNNTLRRHARSDKNNTAPRQPRYTNQNSGPRARFVEIRPPCRRPADSRAPSKGAPGSGAPNSCLNAQGFCPDTFMPPQQPPLEFENRVQEPFLNDLRKSRRNVHVYLRSGARLEGVLASFDAHMIQIRGAEQQTIYKHEIVSILRAPFGRPKSGPARTARAPADRGAWRSALGSSERPRPADRAPSRTGTWGDDERDAERDLDAASLAKPRKEPVILRKPVATRSSDPAQSEPRPAATAPADPRFH